MRTLSVLFLAVLVSVAVASNFLFVQPRLEQALKNAMANGVAKQLPVMVHFKQMDVQRFYAIESADKRAEMLVNDLQAHAELTQASIVEKLNQEKISFKSLWISNIISIRECPTELINWLAVHPLVENVSHDPEVNFNLETPAPATPSQAGPTEWNVEWIQGPQAWELPAQGEGITVGVIDTGVEFKHPILAHAYRGLKEDGSYDHNYNWMQTYGGKSEFPIDDHSHGSHCTGTVLGRDSQGHSYGVAPKAKFIACKFLSASGSGTLEAAVACLQFMLAPTDLDGKHPDSSKRADVTSNSWGAQSDSSPIKTAIDALVAAGVMVVAAAGNSGSRCSSVLYPGGYESSFTVGALEVKSDNVTSFSSRGPIKKFLKSTVKPDISAPGRDIVSAVKGGGLGKMSGTSMATPHVAGGVALVWSAVKNLKNQPQKTRDLLYKFARHVDTKDCTSKGTPNNLNGHGTMQVYDAIKGALKMF